MEQTNEYTPNIEFEAFYNTTADQLYRSVFFRLGSGELASDVTQESYVRVYERWQTYQNNEHRVRALYTIARNLITDHYRKNKNISIDQTQLSEILTTEHTPEDNINTQINRTQLLSMLDQLSATDRDVVISRSIDEIPYTQIAQEHKRPESTIRKIHSRALQKLAKLFQQHYGINYRPY